MDLSSPALLCLDAAVLEGRLSSDRAEGLRARWAQITRAAAAAVERRKDALNSNAELRRVLMQEQSILEATRSRNAELEFLSQSVLEDRGRLQSAVMALESATSVQQGELAGLQQEEAELTDELAQLRAQNRTEVEPALTALSNAIAELKGDVLRASEQAEGLSAVRASLLADISRLRTAAGSAGEAAADQRAELTRTHAEPLRFEKQTDNVRALVGKLSEEMLNLRGSIAARETELADQSRIMMEVASVRRDLGARLKKHRTDMQAQEGDLSSAEKLLRAERALDKDLLERRVELRLEQESRFVGTRAAQEEKDAAKGAYERAKRELCRVNASLNEVVASLPPLEQKLEEAGVEVRALQAVGEEAEALLALRKRESAAQIASFASTESSEVREMQELTATRAELKLSEAQRDAWRKEADLVTRQIAAVKSQRDLRSRELAKTTSAKHATIEHSRMKELVLLDLSKRVDDAGSRLARFTAMYEVVKGERNSFSSSISTMGQSIAEMRERLKVLTNEVEILTHESSSKDAATTREHTMHTTASQQRDVLRVEVNKAAATLRLKQADVESAISSIDKLNAVITTLERDTVGMRKAYEAVVEARNYAGVQLIDRNDELCIMYEKSRIHERALTAGESALTVVTDEVRSLSIASRDLERQVLLARSRSSDAHVWAERILLGQRDLAHLRTQIEGLCMELESPSSAGRSMFLEGEDPPADALRRRVAELEAKLNAARMDLLNADMAVEDAVVEAESTRAAMWALSSVADDGGAAAEGVLGGDGGAVVGGLDPPLPSAQSLAELSELEHCIQGLHRRMLATVSEMSMYQATAIKLGAETEAAHEALAKAEAAAARGEAPTAAAGRAQAVVGSRARTSSQQAAVPGPAIEQRPNAYIPEQLGIPKPFGASAPFKPSAPSSNLKYYAGAAAGAAVHEVAVVE